MKNKFWNKVFFGGCAIFSVAMVLISILMLIINTQTTENVFDIKLSSLRALLIAVFCFVFSFANTFYRVDGMKEWIRLALHFIITTVGFFVCIYSPVSAEGNLPAENSFVVIGLFSAVYFLCYGIYRLIAYAVKKSKAKKEEYTPVFKKQSRK